MIIDVAGKLVALDLFKEEFVCNISKCKGQCCIDGDAGAPLEEEELTVLDDIYEDIRSYLREEGREVLEKEGKYVIDTDGEAVTPLIKGKECAYVVFEKDGTASCGIEKAYLDGKTKFKKPISCHLYPIRVLKLSSGDALNYHRWPICSDACELGKELQVPVFRFLKEPIIRKYGESFYNELENVFEEMKKTNPQFFSS